MSKISVQLGERSYEIVIEPGVLDRAGAEISSMHRGGTVAVISNPRVAGLYASALTRSLDAAGIPHSVFAVPMGERYKSLSTCRKLYEHFLDIKLDRAGMVIALGGGVIGDLAGFTAGTFVRGVDFVQIPTTLLAQVDASVGGKTAVDLPRGKNLVGVFHQPKRVLIDTNTLKSLPKRELRAGLAEVFKHGIIHDQYLFDFTRDNAEALLNAEPTALEVVIRRSCEFKADVVRRDERESGLRAILNFGHTIGHAIETLTGYSRFKHGEAVSMGMAAAARLSAVWGYCTQDACNNLITLLEAAGLPVQLPSMERDSCLAAIQKDKKRALGTIRMVLMKSIGEVFIEEISTEKLASAFKDTLQMQ